MGTFRDAIRSRDFVVTAELPLDADQSMQDLHQRLALLRPVVDAVQVGCGEGADTQIAPLAAATVARDAGVDSIVHVSSRDRNRIALQSDILGALAQGITTLILRRGEKLPSTLRGRVKGVFDTKTSQLLAFAGRAGERSRLAVEGVFLGCLVSAFRPEKGWQAKRVRDKLDAGAGFIQTRPCLELDVIREYVSKLVTLRLTHRASVIIGVPLLTSAAAARTIEEKYPGTTLPDSIVARLADATDPRVEGVRMLASLLSELRSVPGVAGVAILNVDDVGAAAEAIGLSGVLDQTGTG